MFWRKPRRSPEAQLVAGIFGEEMARTYEGFAQSPGQQDISNLYLAAVGVAQRFPTHRTEAVSRLHQELQALAQVHPTERDSALLGYGGLASVLDKGILTAMDAGLFLTVGEHLTGRAPLHAWAPVAAWRKQLPATMDPAARMWA